MRFDVYGRFQLEVRKEAGQWTVYRVDLGKRTRINYLAIPEEIQMPEEIARYLDDMYHEAARPGDSISVITE
jgi:hypothetical protein